MSRDIEARRQQLLLQALWRELPEAALAGWLREGPARAARGLQAYRHNGEAVAHRALAASHPTVAELLGDEAFAAVARSHWRAHPPTCGDMGCYGAGLADTLAQTPQLAEEPYLPDCARLDWAVHRLEVAADLHEPPQGLALLGTEHPARLAMVLRPGLVLVSSRWPVATLWQAHRQHGPARFAAVREAFAEGRGEHALAWREGWRPRVSALGEAEAHFTRALLAACTVSAALDAAGPGFAFEPWLLQALQHGWLAAVLPCTDPAAGDER
ncbi:MAG: putative DNA-binding domain-containing protein [Burkholderiales bacterium]|nr:putative DNA-binding domain-containing protein [Burkholderiales bacterium]